MLNPSHVRCGVAVADAAYVVPVPPRHTACPLRPPDPGIVDSLTTVVLQPVTDHVDHNVGGALAPGVLPDGRTRLVTGIPATDLQIVVTSPDPAKAQRLLDGLRIIDLAHGCAVLDDAATHDALGGILAADVRGGSLCAYDSSGRLMASRWLGPGPAKDLADLLRADASASSAACSKVTFDAATVHHWLVHLRVASGEPQVEVQNAPCDATALTRRLGSLLTLPFPH